MIFRSLPKRDLFPETAALSGGSKVKGLRSKVQGRRSKVKGLRSKVQGQRSKVQGQRSKVRSPNTTVHGSRFTVHCSRLHETGFTLIEVIAALIIVAVLATMIFPATGGGLWRTARGVGECRELFELQGQMEQIVQTYKTALSNGNGAVNLEDFRDSVIGYSYVDTGSTGFLEESGSDLTLTATPTSLLLVTLVQGDQRIASVFSQ